MKIYLDTANLREIEEGVACGLVDGITTNPTLVAKETSDLKEHILKICRIVEGVVNAEVVSTRSEAMIREAREIAAWHKNIVVKIPMTKEGMKAVKVLRKEGIRTNVTLVFSANQALLAAKAGATFVSPFVGRIDDIGEDGMQVVADILTMYRQYGLLTEVLTASVRHPMHFFQAAKLGSHIATLPFAVFQKLFSHPLTDIGLKRFLADWEKAQAAVTV